MLWSDVAACWIGGRKGGGREDVIAGGSRNWDWDK